MMKKKNIYILPILIVIAIIFFIILKFSPKSQIKHIFLITIDTLRADHLGSHGYPRNTSPFIDSIAEKGIMFTKAFSQSSSTCPSHASIFTGLYPYQHGVLANHYILEDSHTTIAEILKKKGYHTAAFASTDVHFHATHLDQGFDFYEEPINSQQEYRKRYRPAALTINNAIIWLSNFNPHKKLFLWIHLYDPHRPYYVTKRYKAKIDKNKTDLLDFLEALNIDHKVFNHNIDKLYNYITKYDAEIRYVDDELKRFFNYTETKGLNKKALWVITSDHGEGLGQHNYLVHSNMIYQEQLHVPLIFYFTSNQIKPRKINQSVENFNIFSTILDILKIDLKNSKKRRISSVSLWPMIKSNNSRMGKQFIFSEREVHPKEDPFPPRVPYFMRNWERGNKYSVQNDTYKYIFRTDYEDEFYDLEKDPHETKNLIQKDLHIKEKLMAEILKYYKLCQKYSQRETRIVDKKILKKLKSLGYLH